MSTIRRVMVSRLVPLVLAAGLIDCHTPPPTYPVGFLTGSWMTNNPAGYFQVDLESSGGLVTGTALDVCCGSSQIETHGTVTGTYGGGGFTLQFSFPKPANWFWMGTKATWTGHLSSFGTTDELVGPLTVTAPVDSSLGTAEMFREPTP